nr:hypothetical protein [Planococcus soli]
MPVAHPAIYWSTIEYNSWKFHIARTEKGLCYVGSPGESLEKFTAYFNKRFPAAALVKNDGMLSDYSQELTAYLKGSHLVFSLPTDVQGTPFQQQTWQALKNTVWADLFLF